MNTAIRTCHFTVLAAIGLCFVLAFAQPVRAEEVGPSTFGTNGKPAMGAGMDDRMGSTTHPEVRPFMKPGMGSTTPNGLKNRDDLRPCMQATTTKAAAATSTPCRQLTPPGNAWGRDASNTPDGAKWAAFASSTRAHFGEQITKFLKTEKDNHEKRDDKLAKIKTRVSMENYNAIKSILERLGDAQDKLTELLTKIEDSLSKATAAGKDVSAAQTAVTAAETDLTAAQTAIDNATAVIDAATASSTKPKDHIDAIRTAVNTATEKEKTAQMSIMAAVKAARSAVGMGSTTSQI